MLGQKLKDLDPWSLRKGGYYAVKEAVLPFNRFPGVDTLLGPEMRSTGEVMGVDPSLGLAFMKSQLAAGQFLPASGCVFISVNDHDKPGILVPARTFQKLGFTIMSTRGTAAYLASHGVQCQVVNKVYEGRPNVIDHIKNGDIQLVINTSSGKRTKEDSSELRRTTVLYGLPYTTNLAAAKALALAIKERGSAGLNVQCLQEYYRNSGRDF